GMAVKDQNEPHGLKLTIEDYPFANDGLLLWDAIKEWVTSYVEHYYPQANLVKSDKELQAWWDEIRTVGHGDKKDEPWWPQLKTQADLIKIVSTMIWVTSGYHAAINFGQYDFTGYFPNRPTIAGTKMPNEDTMKKSGREKYIGGDIEEAWKVKPAIKVAFEKFKGTLKEIEDIIDTRNANPELRNRSGARLVPYQLLKPNSVSGVTGMGVPNSISI
ncbi:linoleate 13S-lipoxygenase 2-1, chloroplastic-like protein, partial [Tanacetum coccineum]